MSYRPEDYQVTDCRIYDDGGMAFDVKIKGAEFTIYRYMNRFKPTPIFKFNTPMGLLYNEERIATGAIEIDWNTCLSGMQHIADQMGKISGMQFKVIPGVIFSNNGRLTYFKEEAV